MRKVILLTTLTLILAAGTSLADGIQGRLGLTGKVGVFVPLRDDFVSSTSESDPGLAAGGGLIFGVSRNLAVEVDATHVTHADVNISGSKAFEATLTCVALGISYRIGPDNHLVPFLGAGADFIKGGLTHVDGARYDMDWTEGGHVEIGLDYFLTKGIALTLDMRGVAAVKGDVKSSGTEVGKYDPMSFLATAGIRLFLPEHLSP